MTGGGRTDARARALAGLLARSRAMVDDDGPGFPAWSEADGSWRRRVAGEWSSGYPVGMLWLAAGAAALDPAVARRWMLRLGVPTGSRSAFRGFVSYYGAVLGDVLLADCAARDLTVAGARALAEDRHPGAGIVPLDERGARLRPGLVETSIDAVGPTTGLLARAAALTGDGELAALAEHQVRWHLRTLLRDDGSMAQYALLAPEDGRVVDVLTGPQGAGRDSTWARSQGWGLLAAALAGHWLLLDGCHHRRAGLAPANELVWGDYYLLQALLVLAGELDPLAV